MSPKTTECYGQVIISLYDNETCPISQENLFKGIKKKNKIVDVKNSKFYVPNYDVDLIQGILYSSHNYFEQGFLEQLNKYLDKNPTIIDIGANIGNHTLYWANEINAKKIYAFEPIPYIFKILSKNVEINNLENVVNLYNIGLSDQNGLGEIKSFCKQNFGGTRLKKLQSNTKYTITLKTLDSLDIKEDKIDLIKIDVEGMDSEVLLGATNTIKKYKPIVIIESFPDNFEKSNSILNSFGYVKELDLGSFEYLYIFKNR